MAKLRRGRAVAPAPARGNKGHARDHLASVVADLKAQQVELEAQNGTLREAQEHLEESRDRYAELFDFAPIAYVTLDEKAVIRNLNLTAAALFGVPRQSAIGYPFVRFVHPDHQARFWGHMARCHRGALDLATDLDLQIRTRPRVPALVVPVQLISAPNVSGERTPEYRTAVLDLRDRRLAEDREAALVRESARREEAERSSQAKDEFFSLLAHELRTPLNAIHGWTHLLSAGQLTEEEKRRAVDVIARNVHIQVALIDEMLDLSRIVRGALELSKGRVDFLELIRASVDGIRPMASDSRLHLECQLDPIAAYVIGDRERLSQVLLNLLTNAIKFTPTGGRIRIQLDRAMWTPHAGSRSDTPDHDRREECARLTISDTGKGIGADELPHVFDRFWRGRNATARHTGGLGLGLAIARRLVEMHGGTLRAESEGEDCGSTFTIELPLEWGSLPPSYPRRIADVSAASSDLHDVRVLLVDDDENARDIVRRVLEPLGAIVTSVSSAREAFEAIRRLKPDVLLSDLAMPEEDGLSLIRRIRGLPPEEGGVTPAIALTAWAGAGDEGRVLAAGFETFVAKPVDPQRLGELIGSMVAVTARRHR